MQHKAPPTSTRYLMSPIDTYLKTLKCILVGADSKSYCLIFYHPQSKQLFLAENGFCIDSTLYSGEQFQETYDNTFMFNTKSTSNSIHCPHSYGLSNTIYYIINKILKKETFSTNL